MIIRCDRCDTEFSLDDSQMREGGTAVRCSVCSHVFTVHPPDPRDVGHRPWQIRTEDGVLFSAKNLRVVSNWIQESRLDQNDEISRTGHRWRKLSEVPEFRRLLGLEQGAAGIEVLSQSKTPQEESKEPKGSPVQQSAPRSEASPKAGLAAGGSPVGAPGDESAKQAANKKAASPPAPPAPTPAKAKVASKGTLNPPANPPELEPVHGSISAELLPTESESEEALDDLRQPVKTLRSVAPSTPHEMPRMSASIQQRPEEPEQGKEQEEVGHTRSGVSVGDMRSRIRAREPSLAELEAESNKRRAKWVAGASCAAAIAVVGLLWWQGGESGPEGAPKEAAVVQDSEGDKEAEDVHGARSALQAMDPAALRELESKLHAQMQREDLGQSAQSRARFLLIQLLTERALQLSLAATLAPHDAQMLLDASRSDVMRARTLFEAESFKEVDPLRRQVVQLRLEFAEGRPLQEVRRLLPEQGAPNSETLLKAAPIWRDAHDGISEGVLVALEESVETLNKAQSPSMLLQEALAVAQLRRGNHAVAQKWAKARLEVAISDPVALRVQDAATRQAAANKGMVGDSGVEANNAATSTAEPKKKEEDLSRLSVDNLIDRGCRLVERGASAAGIEILLHALERDGQNLDVLLCLAQGYARSGDQAQSLRRFEQILQRSPKHRSALYGAATQAAAQGDHQRASKHYRALLDVEPGHGPASAYLEVHGAS